MKAAETPQPIAAFPNSSNTLGYRPVTQPGMSLRDWFAGQALSGIVVENHYRLRDDVMASEAYGLADAMMKAREKRL